MEVSTLRTGKEDCNGHWCWPCIEINPSLNPQVYHGQRFVKRKTQLTPKRIWDRKIIWEMKYPLPYCTSLVTEQKYNQEEHAGKAKEENKSCFVIKSSVLYTLFLSRFISKHLFRAFGASPLNLLSSFLLRDEMLHG